MRKSLIAALLLAAVGSNMAMANDQFYAGAAVTRDDVRATQAVEDHLGTGLKVYGGYRLNDNFAVEAAYSEGRGLKVGEADLIGRQLSASLVGNYPLGANVSAIGKVGLAHTYLDGTGFGTRKNDVVYGVGLEYAVNAKVSLRGEIERYEDYARTGEALNQVGVGAYYRF